MLKPHRADITLWYQCDNCGAEHDVPGDQLKYRAGVKCYCGKELLFLPIRSANLKIDYRAAKSPTDTKGQTSKPQWNNQAGLPDNLRDDCISALTGLGYKKPVAKDLVNRYIGDYDSVDNFLAYFLTLDLNK